MDLRGPGPVFDVIAVLNGSVDLGSYQRSILVLSSAPVDAKVYGRSTYAHLVHEPVVHLANGIEFLESRGWQLVSVVERNIDGVQSVMAFMRRV